MSHWPGLNIGDLKVYPHSDLLPPTETLLLQKDHHVLTVSFPVSFWGPFLFKPPQGGRHGSRQEPVCHVTATVRKKQECSFFTLY